jgi:hypothetical protein
LKRRIGIKRGKFLRNTLVKSTQFHLQSYK